MACHHVSLLNPYITSNQFHSDTPSIIPQVPSPSHPKVLQVLNVQKRGKPDEVRLVITGKPSTGQWVKRSQAHDREGFADVWETFDGPDKLLLDAVEVTELPLQLSSGGKRYSTYRVSSPLSPKDENFWKVAAKEIFKPSELGEKERREVLEFIFQEDSGLPTLG
ncbi:hypothetical protein J008_06699 [Cryptococcus neoformans]|nr:hypothetical protein J008_06699 [Cryptococcus neoformans var. grubii]